MTIHEHKLTDITPGTDNGDITVAPLRPDDIPAILEWNEGFDAAFLTQWAGQGYNWPLTFEQVAERLDARFRNDFLLFKVTRGAVMAGTLEINFLNMPPRSATVCRVLLAAEHRGRGLGVKALLAAEDYCRDKLSLDTLRLKVFLFNRAAVKCYKKAGYATFGVYTYQNGWAILEMEKKINTENRKTSGDLR